LGKFASKMVDEAFSEIKVVETSAASKGLGGLISAIFGSAIQDFGDRPNSFWGKLMGSLQRDADPATKTVKILSAEFAAIKREGEESIDTLIRVYSSLMAVNDVFDLLEHSSYEATLILGDVASTMVDAFGGLE